MKRWMLILSCLLLLVGCQSKDERLRELTANSWKVTLVSDQNNNIVSVMTEDGLTDESYARSLVFNEDHTFMMSFPQNNEEWSGTYHLEKAGESYHMVLECADPKITIEAVYGMVKTKGKGSYEMVFPEIDKNSFMLEVDGPIEK